MTIEKFIEKHCCTYGMHVSEPCERKLILSSLYGRIATGKIKVKDDGKRSAFENSLVCVAVNGALRGSQNLQKRKENRRKEPSEETQEEIEVCLNCTEKRCPGSRKCMLEHLNKSK